MRPLAAILLVSLAPAACAAPTSYMGKSFAPSAAAGDLQELARRAQTRDKQAQLDLGIAYEEGRGVAVDLKRAEFLLRSAASESNGTLWVYSPANGMGGRGSIVSVRTGPKREGSYEATLRLVEFDSHRDPDADLLVGEMYNKFLSGWHIKISQRQQPLKLVFSGSAFDNLERICRTKFPIKRYGNPDDQGQRPDNCHFRANLRGRLELPKRDQSLPIAVFKVSSFVVVDR